METIRQTAEILKVVPQSLANSIGFAPGFATIDFVFSFLKYKMKENFNADRLSTQVLAHIMMGLLRTSQQCLWLDYAGFEGTGWEVMMANMKELPSNVSNSMPFIGGYAFLDFIYERAKTMMISGSEIQSWKTELMLQSINAVNDASNVLYWDNYAPQAQNQ